MSDKPSWEFRRTNKNTRPMTWIDSQLEQVAMVLLRGIAVRALRRGDLRTLQRILDISQAGAKAEDEA